MTIENEGGVPASEKRGSLPPINGAEAPPKITITQSESVYTDTPPSQRSVSKKSIEMLRLPNILRKKPKPVDAVKRPILPDIIKKSKEEPESVDSSVITQSSGKGKPPERQKRFNGLGKNSLRLVLLSPLSPPSRSRLEL